MTIQILINIVYSSAIYLGLALSFNIIYTVHRFFHIAHAIFIVLGAYIVLLFNRLIPNNILISICIAVFLCATSSVILNKYIFQPLRKKSASPLVLLITSLGVYIIFQNMISIFGGEITQTIRNHETFLSYQISNGYITDLQIIFITACLFITLSFSLFYNFSKLGREMLAVSSNPVLSSVFGINIDKIHAWSFALGSGLASFFGILYCMDFDFNPRTGFDLLLYGVIAMIVGGTGSIRGLVFGSIFISTTQHLCGIILDSKWMEALAYAILIVFIIWKPLGFKGNLLKKSEI